VAVKRRRRGQDRAKNPDPPPCPSREGESQSEGPLKSFGEIYLASISKGVGASMRRLRRGVVSVRFLLSVMDMR